MTLLNLNTNLRTIIIEENLIEAQFLFEIVLILLNKTNN